MKKPIEGTCGTRAKDAWSPRVHGFVKKMQERRLPSFQSLSDSAESMGKETAHDEGLVYREIRPPIRAKTFEVKNKR
jgi:hypothetical protein